MNKTSMEIISACRVCGSKDIKPFFDLGKHPFAESFPLDTKEESFFPLSLSWCPECSLVQLNETLDPKDLFSTFLWVTGTSKTANEFADIFYRELLVRSPQAKKGYVLEIASNDGTFLAPFIKNGYRVLGVDPAQNLKPIAEKNGVSTIADFWGNKLAKEVLKKEGSAPMIFARNVLPHVANTHDFIEGLKTILADDGTLAIEAHYAKVIQEELHYDYIYHSHLCYFTLKSLERLLNDHSLFIFDLLPSPISGGGIIIYAKKQKTKQGSLVNQYREEEERVKINNFENWQSFASCSFAHREKLIGIVREASKNKKIVGYGASARGSTLLNFCGINNEIISAIGDRNSLKQDHFMPGVRIPIVTPEAIMKEKPSTILLLAWNFADEIINSLRKEFDYQGDYIIPLPGEPRLKETKV